MSALRAPTCARANVCWHTAERVYGGNQGKLAAG